MRYVIEFRNTRRLDGLWNVSDNYELSATGRRGSRRLRDIEFANLAEAREQAQRQQANSLYNIYRVRDTDPELQEEPVTAQEWRPYMEQSATPARAVRIYRRERRWVIDTVGREVPVIAQITPYLPSSLKGIRHEHYTVMDALAHGVSPQILSSALSAWYMEHPNTGEEIAVEQGITELPDNNAYMALGDFIYKMVPVRQAGSSKAVRLMREKVRVEIERVREGLRQQASNEAQQVIAQAQQRAATIRAEAERERQAETAMLRFPAWCKGSILKEDSDPTKYMLLSTSITITKIVHGSKQWSTKADIPRTVRVDLWMPLSGTQERVHLAFPPNSKSLPHISSSSSCVKIGERIEPIENYDRMLRFQGQIARAMGTINLASLLIPDIDHWIPEVVRMLPDRIKAWLETYRAMVIQRDNAEAIAALPPPDNTEGGAETWSVQ